MDFDKVISREAEGVEIEYGFLPGGADTVFIKAGRGGTYQGVGEKYLRFASFLREKYGVSVLCASNPGESRGSCEADISALSELAKGAVYLWGTSDGAFKCIDVAEKINFRKAVLVNMPLMINFYKNKERLKKLPRDRVAFAFGERDASMKFTPFLFSLGCEFVTIAGAEHTLDMTDAEIALFGKLLFEAERES